MMNIVRVCALLFVTMANNALGRMSYERSFIVLPEWEQKGPKTPHIIGCALNKNGTPIRRESIVVAIDGIDMANVFSDARGIWSREYSRYWGLLYAYAVYGYCA